MQCFPGGLEISEEAEVAYLKLGKRTEVYTIRAIEQVFNYSTPGGRRRSPAQAHSSILHTVVAFILFLT